METGFREYGAGLCIRVRHCHTYGTSRQYLQRPNAPPLIVHKGDTEKTSDSTAETCDTKQIDNNQDNNMENNSETIPHNNSTSDVNKDDKQANDQKTASGRYIVLANLSSALVA